MVGTSDADVTSTGQAGSDTDTGRARRRMAAQRAAGGGPPDTTPGRASAQAGREPRSVRPRVKLDRIEPCRK